jgi:hypothetical protein
MQNRKSDKHEDMAQKLTVVIPQAVKDAAD